MTHFLGPDCIFERQNKGWHSVLKKSLKINIFSNTVGQLYDSLSRPRLQLFEVQIKAMYVARHCREEHQKLCFSGLGVVRYSRVWRHSAQFSVVQLESGALCCLVSYSSSSSGELSMAELHPLPPPTRAPMRVRSTSNLAAQFTGKLWDSSTTVIFCYWAQRGSSQFTAAVLLSSSVKNM